MPYDPGDPEKEADSCDTWKNKRAKSSCSKRASFDKKEPNVYQDLPPFLYGVKKATTLLKHQVKDQATRLPYVESFLFRADIKDTDYCPYL